MLIRSPKDWEIPGRLATPEKIYFDRRRVLKALAAGTLTSALPAAAGLAPRDEAKAAAGPPAGESPYPARRNPKYQLDRPLTDEQAAARFNVFDEFSTDHSEVWKVAAFSTSPWSVHVGGLVEKALTLEVDSLVRQLGLEERLYRHRCVETWAMAVPWTGFPFKRFLELVRPLSKARFVRMVSFSCPEHLPGWYGSRRVFPYYESLSIEEASNELAFLATGIYGHPLPPQHGAPLRLVVPWKYGLKSIKSIAGFQFTLERPGTFWNDLSPGYYSFGSNVDPDHFPGPWSQKQETLLGTTETRPTKPFNGYAEQVAHLYPGSPASGDGA